MNSGMWRASVYFGFYDDGVSLQALEWHSVFSVSSYSSEQSTKAKTQKELLKTLQELKAHLPSEKRIKGKSSVLTTLKYALKSIKQVKGKQV